MKLCLGTVQFGLKYGIQGAQTLSPREAVALLHRAHGAGIRVFDTASAYGTAEEVLGAFVAEAGEDSLELISKLRPDALQALPAGQYADAICREAEASLKRLNATALEGYMFHNAGYIGDAAAVEAMGLLKKNGLAKHVGVSIYTPQEAMKALEYDTVDIIQIPYNALDHRLDQCGFFRKAKDRGIRIYARSALLQGLLTMEPAAVPEKMHFAMDWLRTYWDICRHHGLTPYQAAVQYVLSNPNIDHLVFGVDNMAQLEDYLRLDCQPNGELVAEMDRAFAQVPDRLVMPNLW